MAVASCAVALWLTLCAMAGERSKAPSEPAPGAVAAPAVPGRDAKPQYNPGACSTPPDQLPYVYTMWKHFTVKERLPSDHIMAVKADGPRVWVGTEEGLACIDKRSGKVRTWHCKDEDKDGRSDDPYGLPWKVVTAIDVDKKTGDVWLGLFGGGLARFSGGRFDHFHQLNSGLVNDVVYGVAIENDHVWAATTAGASRYNTITGEWSIYTEKNAPMEEIWNYNVQYDGKGKVFFGIWGSGILEFNCKKDAEKKGDPWKLYTDPDGEMEIDLYRDDGIVHVIMTGASPAEDILWGSSYFGCCRYDGRHWRGLYAHETGLPSDFTNNLKARSANECWFAHDKGLGVVADFPTETVVAYTRDPDTLRGKAQVYRCGKLLKTVDMEKAVPHSFIINLDHDGDDYWVATGKGLGWAIGEGYYPGLRKNPAWLVRSEKERAVAGVSKN